MKLSLIHTFQHGFDGLKREVLVGDLVHFIVEASGSSFQAKSKSS